MSRAPTRGAGGADAAQEPAPDQVEGAPHPRETAGLHGQEAAERAFLAAWAGGRLHHAWLLRGPRGVGKATLAYRLARALLVHGDAAPETLDIDPQRPVARRVAAGSEPRLKTLRRSADKSGKLRTQLTVDVVRDARAFFGLTAADGGWRVAIVDPADEMNPSAANALLKILEEPPQRAMLLLVSHAPGRLLPTIRSRCRTLDLGPLDGEAFAKALAEAGAAEAAPPALGVLAGGSPGEALRLAAEDGPALYARLARLMAGAPGLDRAALIALADAAAGRAAAARYAMTLELTGTLLRRLARAGALGHGPEAAPGEAALAARLAPDAARARLWAEMAAETAAKADRARLVNLDPAGVILDIWLAIDAAAGRAIAA
ncbi:DNA polymerase III subunit delta' [Rubrimonas cliftonensis]|uniref:DNA polymerase III, delta prime subunit n=1 Tax=Rubrimonas cliftonensis TaxID=89524 RepID=A0A1H3VHH7_9RHOB|nr:DNA polymerase III subunit delta' [Rubrimonas cliftonensis]SDZ73582.1 DNA polymerase III, delta prime subunit [Rubrimonas cliftonensis]